VPAPLLPAQPRGWSVARLPAGDQLDLLGETHGFAAGYPDFNPTTYPSQAAAWREGERDATPLELLSSPPRPGLGGGSSTSWCFADVSIAGREPGPPPRLHARAVPRRPGKPGTGSAIYVQRHIAVLSSD
jgi:hypothetical protein